MPRSLIPSAALGYLALGAAVLSLAGCRGEPPRAAGADRLEEMVARLVPAVEDAAGLEFKETPRAAIRTREQVRAYLIGKMDESLPPERLRGMETAYRLFGLLPDTLELRPLLLDLLTEQVAGYYEPDSNMFFGVEGTDTNEVLLRSVLAHEMVHALQDQYLPLDSLVEQRGDNDRATAAQAILEGQAMLVMMQVLTPQIDLINTPGIWDQVREQLESQRSSMPVFAAAPRILRETLVFPYLDGADFMRWWRASEWHDTVPYGPRMPVSTEQILHPFRYGRGDAPIRLRFADSTAAVAYEDVLGEFEIHVLRAELTGSRSLAAKAPIGWGGDRYRVYESPDGPALVWYTVWDEPAAADRFLGGTAARLAEQPRAGYRGEAVKIPIDGRPGVRVVIAPERWRGWRRVPAAGIAG